MCVVFIDPTYIYKHAMFVNEVPRKKFLRNNGVTLNIEPLSALQHTLIRAN